MKTPYPDFKPGDQVKWQNGDEVVLGIIYYCRLVDNKWTYNVSGFMGHASGSKLMLLNDYMLEITK